jgi:hypothetical protein
LKVFVIVSAEYVPGEMLVQKELFPPMERAFAIAVMMAARISI